jgi:hypothetical protein
MEKDKKAIIEFMSKNFKGVNLYKVFPVTTDTFIEEMEEYIEGQRVEAIGWTHAYACVNLDEGKDLRHQDCSEMLESALIDLQK